jgi:hypothetical protein
MSSDLNVSVAESFCTTALLTEEPDAAFSSPINSYIPSTASTSKPGAMETENRALPFL